MAVDAALLRHASRTGHAVWRVYGWTSPALSFGRNETVVGRFDVDSIASAGFDPVRRPTGGRALLHSREVTYSVGMPLATDVSWRVAYGFVNAILVDALQTMGVDARLADASASGETGATRPTGALCFALPSAGEIMVGGAKLVGSSVWRDEGAYLQHGSLLLHDDQDRIAEAALVALPATPPAAALASLPGFSDVSDAELTARTVSSFVNALSRRGDVTAFTADASMLADVARAEDRFRRPEWLWRR